jgi:hydroxypyruvate reductase
LPRAGVTLREKRAAIRRLVRRGAPIEELNRMRVRLSAIKGGRLAAHTRARVVSLVLSDVSGDRPEVVGSGPTIRRSRGSRKRARSGDIVRVVGSNRTGLEAAAAYARAQGRISIVLARRIAGEAFREGRRFAARAASLSPGEILLAGGEPTVRLGRTPGRGGRTLELALAAALELERLGATGVSLLAAASDGIDGSSPFAGALVDASTASRARARNLDPESALERHDTARFFERLGDGLRTGPTGTNVCDWVVAVRT